MAAAIIAVIIGILSYVIAAFWLPHVAAMAIGILVGLLWYFGSNRPL